MTIFHSYVELDPHSHMAYLNLQIELEHMAKLCKIVDKDEWLSIARSLEAGGSLILSVWINMCI
jgi:hypothetical protein